MPEAPISWGELIDKITILRLKADRVSDPQARAHVRHELAALETIAGRVEHTEGLAPLTAGLADANTRLWDIEDRLREMEAAGDFGAEFVALARAVYRTNDLRAALKRQISRLLKSDIVEEKSYAGGKIGPA